MVLFIPGWAGELRGVATLQELGMGGVRNTQNCRARYLDLGPAVLNSHFYALITSFLVTWLNLLSQG